LVASIAIPSVSFQSRADGVAQCFVSPPNVGFPSPWNSVSELRSPSARVGVGHRQRAVAARQFAQDLASPATHIQCPQAGGLDIAHQLENATNYFLIRHFY